MLPGTTLPFHTVWGTPPGTADPIEASIVSFALSLAHGLDDLVGLTWLREAEPSNWHQIQPMRYFHASLVHSEGLNSPFLGLSTQTSLEWYLKNFTPKIELASQLSYLLNTHFDNPDLLKQIMLQCDLTERQFEVISSYQNCDGSYSNTTLAVDLKVKPLKHICSDPLLVWLRDKLKLSLTAELPDGGSLAHYFAGIRFVEFKEIKELGCDLRKRNSKGQSVLDVYLSRLRNYGSLLLLLSEYSALNEPLPHHSLLSDSARGGIAQILVDKLARLQTPEFVHAKTLLVLTVLTSLDLLSSLEGRDCHQPETHPMAAATNIIQEWTIRNPELGPPPTDLPERLYRIISYARAQSEALSPSHATEFAAAVWKMFKTSDGLGPTLPVPLIPTVCSAFDTIASLSIERTKLAVMMLQGSPELYGSLLHAPLRALTSDAATIILGAKQFVRSFINRHATDVQMAGLTKAKQYAVSISALAQVLRPCTEGPSPVMSSWVSLARGFSNLIQALRSLADHIVNSPAPDSFPQKL